MVGACRSQQRMIGGVFDWKADRRNIRRSRHWLHAALGSHLLLPSRDVDGSPVEWSDLLERDPCHVVVNPMFTFSRRTCAAERFGIGNSPIAFVARIRSSRHSAILPQRANQLMRRI